MDIYEKYGVDKTISQGDFLKLLDEKKQLTLRKLNNIFDNPEKEAELKKELDQIEAAELIVKNRTVENSVSTSLLQENESNKKAPNDLQKNVSNEAGEYFKEGVKYYNEGDYEEALRYYRKAANLGHADAQCNLAYLYNKDLVEQPKDGKNDRYWYSKAAEQGNLYAMNALAILYVSVSYMKSGDRLIPRRIGGPSQQEMDKSIELYTRAAEGGLPAAMINLGNLYLDEYSFGGTNKYKNYEKAYQWLVSYKSTLKDVNKKNEIQELIEKAIKGIEFDYYNFQKRGPELSDSEIYEQRREKNINQLKEFMKIATPEDRLRMEATIDARDNRIKEYEKKERTKKKILTAIIALAIVIYVLWSKYYRV